MAERVGNRNELRLVTLASRLYHEHQQRRSGWR
jgi:hypothetical protein